MTAKGRQQAAELGGQLRSTGIELIRSSAIARAIETATIVATALRLPVVLDPRLNEMILGPWEGLEEHDVEKRFPVEYRTWNERPDLLKLDGRETLADVALRVRDVLHDVAQSQTPTLLVTHVALLRVAALTTMDEPLARYKQIAVGNAEAFRLNASQQDVHRLATRGSVRTELKLDRVDRAS